MTEYRVRAYQSSRDPTKVRYGVERKDKGPFWTRWWTWVDGFDTPAQAHFKIAEIRAAHRTAEAYNRSQT